MVCNKKDDKERLDHIIGIPEEEKESSKRPEKTTAVVISTPSNISPILKIDPSASSPDSIGTFVLSENGVLAIQPSTQNMKNPDTNAYHNNVQNISHIDGQTWINENMSGGGFSSSGVFSTSEFGESNFVNDNQKGQTLLMDTNAYYNNVQNQSHIDTVNLINENVSGGGFSSSGVLSTSEFGESNFVNDNQKGQTLFMDTNAYYNDVQNQSHIDTVNLMNENVSCGGFSSSGVLSTSEIGESNFVNEIQKEVETNFDNSSKKNPKGVLRPFNGGVGWKGGVGSDNTGKGYSYSQKSQWDNTGTKGSWGKRSWKGRQWDDENFRGKGNDGYNSYCHYNDVTGKMSMQPSSGQINDNGQYNGKGGDFGPSPAQSSLQVQGNNGHGIQNHMNGSGDVGAPGQHSTGFGAIAPISHGSTGFGGVPPVYNNNTGFGGFAPTYNNNFYSGSISNGVNNVCGGDINNNAGMHVMSDGILGMNSATSYINNGNVMNNELLNNGISSMNMGLQNRSANSISPLPPLGSLTPLGSPLPPLGSTIGVDGPSISTGVGAMNASIPLQSRSFTPNNNVINSSVGIFNNVRDLNGLGNNGSGNNGLVNGVAIGSETGLRNGLGNGVSNPNCYLVNSDNQINSNNIQGNGLSNNSSLQGNLQSIIGGQEIQGYHMMMNGVFPSVLPSTHSFSPSLTTTTVSELSTASKTNNDVDIMSTKNTGIEWMMGRERGREWMMGNGIENGVSNTSNRMTKNVAPTDESWANIWVSKAMGYDSTLSIPEKIEEKEEIVEVPDDEQKKPITIKLQNPQRGELRIASGEIENRRSFMQEGVKLGVKKMAHDVEKSVVEVECIEDFLVKSSKINGNSETEKCSTITQENDDEVSAGASEIPEKIEEKEEIVEVPDDEQKNPITIKLQDPQPSELRLASGEIENSRSFMQEGVKLGVKKMGNDVEKSVVEVEPIADFLVKGSKINGNSETERCSTITEENDDEVSAGASEIPEKKEEKEGIVEVPDDEQKNPITIKLQDPQPSELRLASGEIENSRSFMQEGVKVGVKKMAHDVEKSVVEVEPIADFLVKGSKINGNSETEKCSTITQENEDEVSGGASEIPEKKEEKEGIVEVPDDEQKNPITIKLQDPQPSELRLASGEIENRRSFMQEGVKVGVKKMAHDVEKSVVEVEPIADFLVKGSKINGNNESECDANIVNVEDQKLLLEQICFLTDEIHGLKNKENDPKNQIKLSVSDTSALVISAPMIQHPSKTKRKKRSKKKTENAVPSSDPLGAAKTISFCTSYEEQDFYSISTSLMESATTGFDDLEDTCILEDAMVSSKKFGFISQKYIEKFDFISITFVRKESLATLGRLLFTLVLFLSVLGFGLPVAEKRSSDTGEKNEVIEHPMVMSEKSENLQRAVFSPDGEVTLEHDHPGEGGVSKGGAQTSSWAVERNQKKRKLAAVFDVFRKAAQYRPPKRLLNKEEKEKTKEQTSYHQTTQTEMFHGPMMPVVTKEHFKAVSRTGPKTSSEEKSKNSPSSSWKQAREGRPLAIAALEEKNEKIQLELQKGMCNFYTGSPSKKFKEFEDDLLKHKLASLPWLYNFVLYHSRPPKTVDESSKEVCCLMVYPETKMNSEKGPSSGDMDTDLANRCTGKIKPAHLELVPWSQISEQQENKLMVQRSCQPVPPKDNFVTLRGSIKDRQGRTLHPGVLFVVQEDVSPCGGSGGDKTIKVKSVTGGLKVRDENDNSHLHTATVEFSPKDNIEIEVPLYEIVYIGRSALMYISDVRTYKDAHKDVYFTGLVFKVGWDAASKRIFVIDVDVENHQEDDGRGIYWDLYEQFKSFGGQKSGAGMASMLNRILLDLKRHKKTGTILSLRSNLKNQDPAASGQQTALNHVPVSVLPLQAHQFFTSFRTASDSMNIGAQLTSAEQFIGSVPEGRFFSMPFGLGDMDRSFFDSFNDQNSLYGNQYKSASDVFAAESQFISSYNFKALLEVPFSGDKVEKAEESVNAANKDLKNAKTDAQCIVHNTWTKASNSYSLISTGCDDWTETTCAKLPPGRCHEPTGLKGIQQCCTLRPGLKLVKGQLVDKLRPLYKDRDLSGYRGMCKRLNEWSWQKIGYFDLLGFTATYEQEPEPDGRLALKLRFDDRVTLHSFALQEKGMLPGVGEEISIAVALNDEADSEMKRQPLSGEISETFLPSDFRASADPFDGDAEKLLRTHTNWVWSGSTHPTPDSRGAGVREWAFEPGLDVPNGFRQFLIRKPLSIAEECEALKSPKVKSKNSAGLTNVKQYVKSHNDKYMWAVIESDESVVAINPKNVRKVTCLAWGSFLSIPGVASVVKWGWGEADWDKIERDRLKACDLPAEGYQEMKKIDDAEEKNRKKPGCGEEITKATMLFREMENGFDGIAAEMKAQMSSVIELGAEPFHNRQKLAVKVLVGIVAIIILIIVIVATGGWAVFALGGGTIHCHLFVYGLIAIYSVSAAVLQCWSTSLDFVFGIEDEITPSPGF